VVAPERRKRGDVVAAAVMAVVVIAVAVLIWQNSQEHGTLSQTATTTPPEQQPATTVPQALRPLWHAADGSTDAAFPLTADDVVFTADGGTVLGRNPETGAQLWRYQRDLALCGVQSTWGSVVAVYRDRRGCSQVSELDATTGHRITARTGYADRRVTLTSDDSYVLEQGSDRAEVWRSDLVRTVEYGYVDAPVNPDSQPRSGCALLGSALGAAGARTAILEKCPGEAVARLTILETVPKDASKPEQVASALLPDTTPGAQPPRLLVSTGERSLVYLPGTGAVPPRLAVYDDNVKTIAQYRLNNPLSADARVIRTGFYRQLWTGDSDLALDPDTLAPLWAVPADGPGTVMAGQLLVPTAAGIDVVAPPTGTVQRWIPVAVPSTPGPVSLNVVGPVVLEQRGPTLYALGQ
jgi:hypothetical protein